MGKLIVFAAGLCAGLVLSAGALGLSHFNELIAGGVSNNAQDVWAKLSGDQPAKTEIISCAIPVGFNKYKVPPSEYNRFFYQGGALNKDTYNSFPLRSTCSYYVYGKGGIRFWSEKGDVVATYIGLKHHIDRDILPVNQAARCDTAEEVLSALSRIKNVKKTILNAEKSSEKRTIALVPDAYGDMLDIKSYCGLGSTADEDALRNEAIANGYQPPFVAGIK